MMSSDAKDVLAGFLGIDIGTQGLSVTFTDQELNVVSTGEAKYECIDGLDVGCYEQRCSDWEQALQSAMISLRANLAPYTMTILSIGISGQMHGEVLLDNVGQPIQPVRLWCDSRNEMEGNELTIAFGSKIPKRSTVARFLWTIRHRPDVAARTAHITTPAGWLAYRLTGEYVLGIGDASGMFPIDVATLNYDSKKLELFDKLVANDAMPKLAEILPKIRKVGEDAGKVTISGAALLGDHQTGIPVAAAEGDQVAALAGSLIGSAGTVSCCFGTSVCANIVGDHEFEGVSSAVDHFCAADGKPINMVWLRNGTTFLNAIIQSYTINDESMSSGESATHQSSSIEKIMPLLISAPDDCGGLLALPFMDDEPGLDIDSGGSAMIVGWNLTNSKVGNVAKAALLSTMFNLRIGCSILDKQGFPRNEIVFTGGLSKTKACGQILCDVFGTSVTLLSSSEEGSAWGASVMAKYRYLRVCDSTYSNDWSSFLDSIATGMIKTQFFPNPSAVAMYDEMFERYKRLIKLTPDISTAIAIEN